MVFRRRRLVSRKPRVTLGALLFGDVLDLAGRRNSLPRIDADGHGFLARNFGGALCWLASSKLTIRAGGVGLNFAGGGQYS